jgi:hypothetical protein
MKAILVSAAAIGLLSAAPAFAQAGPVSTANGSADAIIVTPITVTADDATGGSINFGKIAADAGTVLVPAASGNSFTSTPGMVVDSTNIHAAHFNVTGETGLGYTKSLGAPTINITDGTGTMSVDLALDSASGAIGDGGFWVGGTLNVNAGQHVGTYTGAFVVNVQYN